jgi:hypothetical protein
MRAQCQCILGQDAAAAFDREMCRLDPLRRADDVVVRDTRRCLPNRFSAMHVRVMQAQETLMTEFFSKKAKGDKWVPVRTQSTDLSCSLDFHIHPAERLNPSFRARGSGTLFWEHTNDTCRCVSKLRTLPCDTSFHINHDW